MFASGAMSEIRLPLRSRYISFVNSASGEMSEIWFCARPR